MTSAARRLPLLLAAGALMLLADFEPSRWLFRRPLPIDGTAPFATFNIDRTIYVASRPDLADLRVVSGADEVPYVLEKMSGAQRDEQVAAQILDQGVTPSGDLELTADAGAERVHNGITLATSKTNFRQRVAIAASDDRRRWTRIRDDGYIFDFSQDGRQISAMHVSYPRSSRRYLRVTIFGWKDPKAITGCFVSMRDDEAAVRDTMASLHTNAELDAKTQSSVYTWDLGGQGIPH